LIICIYAATQILSPTEDCDDDTLQGHFAQFKKENNKSFSSAEEDNKRFAIFKSNFKEMVKHNKSGASYTMGVTSLSDLTADEFKSI